MANQSASGQSPKMETPNGLPAMDVLAKRAALLLRSTPKQKNLNVLLTGFTYDSTDQEDPGYRDPSRYLYCHKNLGLKGALPRCRLMDKTFGDIGVISDADIFYPPGWLKLPQPKSPLELIDRLKTALKWWVEEKVEPESPVFWFYAYCNWACQQRVMAATAILLDRLYDKFKYRRPAMAAELKRLCENLYRKAAEWDAMVQVWHTSQCWVDLRRCSRRAVDPVEVKEAAAALLHELVNIGELIEEEQRTADHAPRNLREWANSDSGTFAVVITDIVESVKLRQRLGDCRMDRILKVHFEQASSLAKKHDGYMFKNTGDGAMALFHTASEAIKFALTFESKTRRRFRIRAGIDVGPVDIGSNDCRGSTVGFAQRVMSKAKEGGVFVSDRAMQDIKQIGEGPRNVGYEQMLGIRLKGIDGAQTLWHAKRKPFHGKQ